MVVAPLTAALPTTLLPASVTVTVPVAPAASAAAGSGLSVTDNAPAVPNVDAPVDDAVNDVATAVTDWTNWPWLVAWVELVGMNVAVRVSLPTGSTESPPLTSAVSNEAVPLLTATDAKMWPELSVNDTKPLGGDTPGELDDTVAVKVTAWP